MMIIVADNQKRSEINTAMLEKMLPQEEAVELKAVDELPDVKGKPPNFSSVPFTHTGNLPSTLTVKIGAPVTLTKNMPNGGKADGLINNCQGYVIDIHRDANIIWIKFADASIGHKYAAFIRKKLYINRRCGAIPIPRIRDVFVFQKNKNLRVSRLQYPDELSFAGTAYKVQGKTLKKKL